MSRTTWNPDRRAAKGLYRDRENAWMFGVCAGIADYSGLGVMAVRIATVVSLILFFIPTALIYAAAILILREKPLIYAGHRDEYDFWRCHRRQDHWRSS